MEPNSVGEEIGLEKGDCITRFNGEEVADILDYEYYEGQERFVMTVKTVGGESVDIEIEKDIDETLGLVFEDKCYLTARACRNKCIFCFVDQLPKGMRKTLYFKDDDWRMSFAAGNYVTFTNLAESEIKRICDKKFSPLYVSVHATDDKVRRDMLQNQTAADIMPLMRRFAQSGVSMHTQIVLCPEVNDGKVLQKSMEDLFSLYPRVATLAIVPVGLTKYRDGLACVKPVDRQKAAEIVAQTQAFAKQCLEKAGTRFVFCSDELYLQAGLPIPSYEEYEDFAQIENGVGLLAKFRQEFDEGLKYFSKAKDKTFTIATGDSAYDFIEGLTERLRKKFGVRCNVVKVINKFFGDTVTVSGLLTSRDILSALAENDVNETVLLPRSLLRETENVFLDGATLEQFKNKVGKNVEVVENDGFDFCAHMLEGEN